MSASYKIFNLGHLAHFILTIINYDTFVTAHLRGPSCRWAAADRLAVAPAGPGPAAGCGTGSGGSDRLGRTTRHQAERPGRTETRPVGSAGPGLSVKRTVSED